MTSIKPPQAGLPTAPHVTTATTQGPGSTGGASSASGAGAVGTASTGAADQARGPSFHEALQQAQGVHAQAAGSAQLASGDPLTGLAQQVSSGQLSMDQALEQLVERAAGSAGRQLTQHERAELRDVVQHALSFDPTLSALRGES